MGRIRNGGPLSADVAVMLAIALENLHAGNWPAVVSALQAEEGGTVTSLVFPPTGNVPAWGVVDKADSYTVVLVAGIPSALQAARMYAGYSGSVQQIFGPGYNTWAMDAKNSILAVLQSKGYWSRRFAFFASGHSAGGMIASLLADQRTAEVNDGRLAFHTFGSPRVTNRDRAIIADRTRGVRWMWWRDPIPLLPLRLEDAFWLIPILGITTLQGAYQFTHWAGGWQLTGQDAGQAREIPSGAAVDPFANVAAWVFAKETAEGVGHSISEYVQNVGHARNLESRPSSNLTRLAPSERQAVATSRARNNAEALAVEHVFGWADHQNAFPPQIPRPLAFRAVRIGRLWAVQLGHSIVAFPGRKKAAQGIAREFNRALLRLQRAAVVDPTALVTELTGYLASATDPNAGFIPTMNTSFGIPL